MFLQMCQKKEHFFPPRLLTHLFLCSLPTAIMLGTVPNFLLTVGLKPRILAFHTFVDVTDTIGGELFKTKPKHL